jgi:hypothetical protein
LLNRHFQLAQRRGAFAVLIPKEHGAYGQLLFPLLSALAIGRLSAGGGLLAVAATSAFLAHEALLVVLGQRGSRAAREQANDARWSLTIFGGLSVAAGAGALLLASRDVLAFLLIPVALAMIVAAAVFTHRERTTGGEVLVGSALSSASLPVALAGGVSLVVSITLVVVFAAVFATATVAVRAVIGRVSKAGGPSTLAGACCAIGALAALAGLASARVLASVAPWAAMPMCGVALGLCMKPPSPKHLRVVGWTLVGATALTAVVLVVVLS